MSRNLIDAWARRAAAYAAFEAHVMGESVDAETWAAVNTPDEAYTDLTITHRPPAHWPALKEAWFARAHEMHRVNKAADRTVRIATGHATVREVLGLS